LLAGSIGLFLVVFSTRIPVYDGERLFLHVFPAWAMLIGLGFGRLWSRLNSGRGRRLLLTGLLLAQGYGTVALHPFGLSYYNLLVGGLPGAERLGLELTYWNDAVDRVLLKGLADHVSPGEIAALAPTLYPGQGPLTTTRTLIQKDVILQDDQAASRAEWLVLSRRRAYWRPELVARLSQGDGEQVMTRQRQGVWLSALWHFPRARSNNRSPSTEPGGGRARQPSERKADLSH
jgi:hypothetical protein